ncbi:hypothetical protein P8452_68829 [Trifolium repens]|nr:hypothetical protein P8452_68829 [Trifolium repens]
MIRDQTSVRKKPSLVDLCVQKAIDNVKDTLEIPVKLVPYKWFSLLIDEKKLLLDSRPKSLEIPVPNKKATGNQYGSVDSGNAQNCQIPSYERSITPVLQDFMDPTMCYYLMQVMDILGPSLWDVWITSGQFLLFVAATVSTYCHSTNTTMCKGSFGDDLGLMWSDDISYKQFGRDLLIFFSTRWTKQDWLLSKGGCPQQRKKVIRPLFAGVLKQMVMANEGAKFKECGYL